jgi:hypothetical protein
MPTMDALEIDLATRRIAMGFCRVTHTSPLLHSPDCFPSNARKKMLSSVSSVTLSRAGSAQRPRPVAVRCCVVRSALTPHGTVTAPSSTPDQGRRLALGLLAFAVVSQASPAFAFGNGVSGRGAVLSHK